MLFNVTTLVEL